MERYERTGDRDTDAVLNGIKEIDERSNADLQMRLSQIHELVLSTAKTHKTPEAVISILSGIRPRLSQRNGISAIERVSLCREYLSLYSGSLGFDTQPFFGPADSLSKGADGKIEYVGNIYTDEARERFLKAVPNGSGRGVGSFEELCEDVYSGRSEYGILPVENTENGKLVGFYSLVDKYELKIAAVTTVSSSDGGNTRFALVRKNIEYPNAPFGSPDTLEFFITLGDGESLSEILAAAEFCSMDIYRIDSLPLSNHSEKFTLCPVFKLYGADIASFLLFMSLDFPRFTPIGIFKEIN